MGEEGQLCHFDERAEAAIGNFENVFNIALPASPVRRNHTDMIEVVCAVIEDAQKGILACQRPAGKHLAGLWEFPGGKVEEKESPALALIREIREELEVEISVLSELEPVEWQYPNVSILLKPYRCRIESGELHAHDHAELRWCLPEQLKGLNWADADRPIVEQILRGRGISY